MTRLVCPIHKITDCSPLYNGCSIVIKLHHLADLLWDEGYQAACDNCQDPYYVEDMQALRENPYS